MSKFIIPLRSGAKQAVSLDDKDDPVFRSCLWAVHGKGAICHASNKLLHRVIMGAGRLDCVEAKNKNLFDCRRANLRLISRSEMMRKRAKARKLKKAANKAIAG